jgi:hypothetical protein
LRRNRCSMLRIENFQTVRDGIAEIPNGSDHLPLK